MSASPTSATAPELRVLARAWRDAAAESRDRAVAVRQLQHLHWDSAAAAAFRAELDERSRALAVLAEEQEEVADLVDWLAAVTETDLGARAGPRWRDVG